MSEATAEQMEEIKGMLALVLERLERPAEPAHQARKSYTIPEAAKLINRSQQSLRLWCRYGRVNASKRFQRRGGSEIWSIAAEEIERYRNEGLLPLEPTRNRDRWESLTVA
jgi:hypothetical protein